MTADAITPIHFPLRHVVRRYDSMRFIGLGGSEAAGAAGNPLSSANR